MLKPGSSRVSISIQNLNCRQVTILAKSNFAKATAANVVPHSYIKTEGQLHRGSDDCQQRPVKAKFYGVHGIKTEKVPTPPALTPERESLLFSRVNLECTKDCSEELKTKIKDLFRDFAYLCIRESGNGAYLSGQT